MIANPFYRTELLSIRFGTQILCRAEKDPITKAAGIPGFVQSVLVPELSIRLVQEDMQVNEDEAINILRESRKLGGILNEETGDHVELTSDDDSWLFE